MLVPRKYWFLVNGPGLHHRENEIAGEFLLQIVNINLGRAGFARLLLQALQLLLLADVGAEGDHFGVLYFSLIHEKRTDVSNPPE